MLKRENLYQQSREHPFRIGCGAPVPLIPIILDTDFTKKGRLYELPFFILMGYTLLEGNFTGSIFNKTFTEVIRQTILHLFDHFPGISQFQSGLFFVLLQIK